MSVKKILAVDDEVEVLDMLKEKLTAEGYDVAVSTDARGALDKAETFFPDLILMDIMLPDSDGAETVKYLKQNPKTFHIPVIFLSGIAPPREQGRGLPEIIVDGEAFPAILKPFSFDELLEEIRKIKH